jgi:hypothetical protein
METGAFMFFFTSLIAYGKNFWQRFWITNCKKIE